MATENSQRNLLNLSPFVQEALLLGDLHLSERRIRALVAEAEWEGYGLGFPLLSESDEGAPLQVDGDARGPRAADANL